jgi:hypothetical protein
VQKLLRDSKTRAVRDRADQDIQVLKILGLHLHRTEPTQETQNPRDVKMEQRKLDPNAFADAMYSGVQIVTDYMEARSNMIQSVLVLPKPDTKHRDNALLGLWLRALAWMQSLRRLDHARHFQAIAAGNRALLEITVDMILLHLDKTNTSGWKMHQWGASEKLRSAENTIRFFEKKKVALPEEYEDLKSFVSREKGLVEHFRCTLWGVNKNGEGIHPQRWSNNGSLFDDIEKADSVFAPNIAADLDSALAQHYRTDYSRLNWHIHSGLPGIGGLPSEAFVIACALGEL